MRVIIFFIISLYIFISCTSETNYYPVGNNFIDTDINIKVIDTFLIKAGTFKFDSLVTSNTNRLLTGTIINDDFGKLTSQPYFQLSLSNFSIPDNAVYDSIGFVLNYDTYFYGDTTKTQTYKIHRVLETVKHDDGSFYNTSGLEFDSESLGQIQFTPRPNKSSDSLYIPINRELGEKIFNKIKDNDINNSDDFLQYFKGLTIVSDTLSNSHVLGFKYQTSSAESGSSYLRLFYTEDDDDSEDNDQKIDLYISSASKQFNSIKTDLNNTSINELNDVETVLSSSQTDDLIFIQAGSGISARIEIPYLKKLNDISDKSAVLKSELRFSPLYNTIENYNSLKDSLAVYVIDHKNRLISQLADIDSNPSYAILNKENDEFNQNAYYSVDMSGFVETVLNSTYDLNYALMVQFVNYNKTVDQVIINNSNNQNNTIKLIVHHLNY
ncbi:DUF4270 family protein [Tenacibaculum sp. IB213877]|uniref:DUF4270 family protein n=1 Tax=Tenacibaculum sp. IB213877 TaxID=3097351 RepID=UPI002A59A1D7|nr:DUF4270 family protein [Tenacibaculum sp. IB213877]MDY0781432.1 DUF4270 family protein [Tenacibaculum sp. IB213877]